jgi:tetratricopeptide (TPR) repeat protein
MPDASLNWKDVLEQLTSQVCRNEISFEKASMTVKQLSFQEQLDLKTLSNAFAEFQLESHRKSSGEIFIRAQLFYEAVRHRYESSEGQAFNSTLVAIYGFFVAGMLLESKELTSAKKLYERHLDDFNDIFKLKTLPNQEIHPIRDFLLSALNNLSVICIELQEIESAKQYCKRAIEIASKNSFFWPLATAYNNLGLIQMNTVSYNEAVRSFEGALDALKRYITLKDNTLSGISRKLFGAKDMEGRIIGNLAGSYCHLGDYKKAKKLFERALKIADETGDKKSKADRLSNFAMLLADQGFSFLMKQEIKKGIEFLEKAIIYYTDAIALSKMVGDDKGAGISIGNLGLALARLGRDEEAIRNFEEALEIARKTGHKVGEANWLNMTGQALFAIGKHEQGISDVTKALRISKEIGFTRGIEDSLRFLIHAYMVVGDQRRSENCTIELETILKPNQRD